MTDIEDILRVLGNPTRFRIIQRLSLGPTYFLDLVRSSDSGPQAVVRHLDMMEEAGIVRSWQEKDSNRRYFALAKRMRIAIDVDSGEVRCEAIRIPRMSSRRAMEAISDPGAIDEMRRVEEELGLLERRLNILRRRRDKLLKKYSK